MVEEGDTAPGFALPGADGDRIAEYSLSDYTSGGVVLLFDPFGFSPVCTAELREFAESEWLSFNQQLDVFGISNDSTFAHQQFIQANDRPFPC